MAADEDLTSEDESDEIDDTDTEERVDEYSGYKPPPGITYLTDRIPADISPAEFFAQYIQARRPAVINGLLTDREWKGHLWTNEYLNKAAGEAKVLVEDRKGKETNVSFGFYAPKIDMKYGDLIKAIEDGETRYYLTTQDLERFVDEYDKFGLPKSVMAEPLRHLKDDFPLQPGILGNLVPHLVTLWQGSAGKQQSTSTGLHHDFHDNLYVLLRGRKRFRLFPPCNAPSLRLTGRPVKIYPNGLIVHPSPSVVRYPRRRVVGVAVRADGAPLAIVAKQRRDDAEHDLTLAEEQLQKLQDKTTASDKTAASDKTSSGAANSDIKLTVEEHAAAIKEAEQRVADCEQKLDEALDDLLQYECSPDDSDLEAVSQSSHSDDEEDNEPSAKQQKLDVKLVSPTTPELPRSSLPLPDHFCNVELPSSDTTDCNQLLHGVSDVSLHGVSDADSVSLHGVSDADSVSLHGVSDADSVSSLSCLTVQLKPGEMLYLPASWFHEVTSYSDSSDDSSGHLALNYWVYPPDNKQFQQPYTDSFWSQRWTNINSRV